MKKIAVACMGDQVSPHFGHCEQFLVFETDGRSVAGETAVPNPGHDTGLLPGLFDGLGASVVLSGGIGKGAFEMLQKKGIEPVSGAKGSAADAVRDYLAGRLQSAGVTCQGHEHHHDDGR